MLVKNGFVLPRRAQSRYIFGNQFTIGALVKDRWKTKVDALIRLAEDQEGKPEGDLVREKLASIPKQ